MSSTSFKDELSFEERKKESTNIRKKYPQSIPIIVEKAKNSKVQDIDKKKFLAAHDLSLGQFQFIIRKRINLDAKTNIL